MTKQDIIKEVEHYINGKYNLGIIDDKIVKDCINKTLEAINYTRCCEELKCDCGNTEDVKNIPICASCYNPHTGEW